ncbi:COG3650 family protein [Rubellimicrobium aerolatum]|uniref:COG3650 family protein n=1 Tax=Rubellimicrobium aerolatum TaxID=490979 RepID=A0ABW0SAB4_9RHOB|nr:SH3 domain-containing protein [Rubellimicrobium aerolatum]MBP1805201.1 putative membrane protein [Rubellimicrobium aerolatum]
MPLPRALLCATTLALAGPAAAEPFPARAAVTGVAAGDALNVRAAPSAGAEVLATLPPDATGVEMLGLSPDGTWARIGRPEGEGWVARRFLAEEPADPRAVPVPLACLGTEPFWNLTVTAEGATFSTPEGERALREIGRGTGFSGFVLAFDDDGATRDLTVVRAACSDGMSDRPYGLTALVWDRDGPVLEGCCTLAPP